MSGTIDNKINVGRIIETLILDRFCITPQGISTLYFMEGVFKFPSINRANNRTIQLRTQPKNGTAEINICKLWFYFSTSQKSMACQRLVRICIRLCPHSIPEPSLRLLRQQTSLLYGENVIDNTFCCALTHSNQPMFLLEIRNRWCMKARE